MRTIVSPRHVDMCHGPLLKNMIPYAIPLILSGILQLLFNAADMVVVGRFCGSTSVGAIGATGSLINLLVNLFMGLSTGSGVIVAMSIGKGDRKETHRAVHTAMVLSVIVGIMVTVVGMICARPLLQLMDTPADVLDLATQYVQIYFAGSIASSVYNFGAAIMRANGDTRRPMAYLTVAGVVNVILNVLLVTVVHLDVAGVAIATVASQTVSAILVVWALCHQHDTIRLELSELRIYAKELKSILKIGIPAALQSATFSVSNMLIQSSVNSFGTAAVAGAAASTNITGFVYTAMTSFRQVTLNFVGQNYGARQFNRVRRVVWNSILCVTVVGLVLGTLCCIFASPLLSLYITDSQDAIYFGIQRMYWLALPYFLAGTMEVLMGALQGIGSSIAPMFINIFFTCFTRMAWILTVFQSFRTLESLYISYPISWILAIAVELFAFRYILRQKQAALQESK